MIQWMDSEISADGQDIQVLHQAKKHNGIPRSPIVPYFHPTPQLIDIGNNLQVSQFEKLRKSTGD